MNFNVDYTVNALTDASERVADITRRKNAALLETAENTAQTAQNLKVLTDNVNLLSKSLDDERRIRAAGDEENKKYTKRYNWFMLILAVITGICTIATTAFTFYNLGRSSAESISVEQVTDSESETEAEYSEQEKSNNE